MLLLISNNYKLSCLHLLFGSIQTLAHMSQMESSARTDRLSEHLVADVP